MHTVGGTSSGSRNVKWLALYFCCLLTEMAEILFADTFFQDAWTNGHAKFQLSSPCTYRVRKLLVENTK